MTNFHKGITFGVFLIGLQLIGGCILQGQSRATAESAPSVSPASTTLTATPLRERILDKIAEHRGTQTEASLVPPQSSAVSPSSTANNTLSSAPAATKIAQRGLGAGVNHGQIVSLIADQMVNRVNQMSCSDFRSSLNRLQGSQKSQNSGMRTRLLGALQAQPELRRTFIDAIAAPLANKMFDCGLVPPP